MSTPERVKQTLSVIGLVAMWLTAASVPQSYADETGVYISGAYGGYKSRGGEFDDENDLYEVSAGFRFLPFLGVEVGYTDLGEMGSDVLSADVSGYSGSVVGFLPFTESFNAYVELGQFFSDVDINAVGFRSDNESETPFFGAGVSFRIVDPLWVIAEYQRYNVDVDDTAWPDEWVYDDDEADVDTLKVGARYYF